MLVTTSTPAQKNEVVSIQWKLAGQLPAGKEHKKSLGFAGPIAGFNHDVLIVAGGANFPDSMPWMGGKKKYYDDGYVFKKAKDGNIAYFKSFKLPFPLAYSASCSTPDGIVSAGGENDNGISTSVLFIHWDKATQNIRIKRLHDLPVALTNASVTAIGDIVYVVGGEMKNEVSNQFFVFNLKYGNQGWKSLPPVPKPVSHAVMVAQTNNGQPGVYVIGGRMKNNGSTSDLFASNFRFDVNTSTWSERKSLPYALSAGTGMATGSDFILLFGGDKGETFHKTEELIAVISKETDPAKKQSLNEQKTQVQSTHPGFSKEVFIYSTVHDKWSMLGSIPFDVPVTTAAVEWGGDVLIPSGEIKAGIRTPQILQGKIVFAKGVSIK